MQVIEIISEEYIFLLKLMLLIFLQLEEVEEVGEFGLAHFIGDFLFDAGKGIFNLWIFFFSFHHIIIYLYSFKKSFLTFFILILFPIFYFIFLIYVNLLANSTPALPLLQHSQTPTQPF